MHAFTDKRCSKNACGIFNLVLVTVWGTWRWSRKSTAHTHVMHVCDCAVICARKDFNAGDKNQKTSQFWMQSSRHRRPRSINRRSLCYSMISMQWIRIKCTTAHEKPLNRNARIVKNPNSKLLSPRIDRFRGILFLRTKTRFFFCYATSTFIGTLQDSNSILGIIRKAATTRIYHCPACGMHLSLPFNGHAIPVPPFAIIMKLVGCMSKCTRKQKKKRFQLKQRIKRDTDKPVRTSYVHTKTRFKRHKSMYRMECFNAYFYLQAAHCNHGPGNLLQNTIFNS